MTFYSKLTRELKRQFKTSDIPIPETRAKCVAIAQRIWEGLYGFDERKGSKNNKGSKERDDSSRKYPCIDSGRDRKDHYYLGHRYRDDQNKDNRNRNNWNRDDQNKGKRRSTPERELTCYKCNKPRHYATSCPDLKESKKAKIQSTQKDHSQSKASSRSSSPSNFQSSSEEPRTPTSNLDSSDSLN
jgi:hypothetical protein